MECMRDVMIIEVLIQYSVPTYIYIYMEKLNMNYYYYYENRALLLISSW